MPPAVPSAAPPTLGRNLVRGTTAFALFSAVGLVLVFVYARTPAAGNVTHPFVAGFALLAVLCAVADPFVGALRNYLFLRRLRPDTSMWLPLRAELATRLGGAITPSQSGGGPAQLLVFHHGGIAVAEALSFLAINFTTYIAFFLVGGIGIVVLLAEHLPAAAGGMLVGYGLVSMVIACAAMVLLVFYPRTPAAMLQRLLARIELRQTRRALRVAASLRTLLGVGEQYIATCERIRRDAPWLIVASLALAGVMTVNRAATGWLLVRAMGLSADFVTTVALLMLLQVALYLVPTPGGAGVAELGTGALMSLVIPSDQLGLFTAGYRAITIYLPAVCGLLVLVGILRSRTRPKVRQSIPAVPHLALVLAAMLPIAQAAAAPARHSMPGCPTPSLEMARAAITEGMAAPNNGAARPAFARAESLARADAACDPTSAEAWYTVAAAIGLQIDRAGLHAKARLAPELRTAAEAALALAPSHAGANHVLGRLHAGAMRLGSFERVVASVILGARFIGEASWAKAELYLTRARDAEPGNPRYAIELGMLYRDTKRPAMAYAELSRAAALPMIRADDTVAVARARAVLASLRR